MGRSDLLEPGMVTLTSTGSTMAVAPTVSWAAEVPAKIVASAIEDKVA